MNRGIIVGIERSEKYPDIYFLHVEYDSIHVDGKSVARVKYISPPPSVVLGAIVEFVYTYDRHGIGYFLGVSIK